MTRATAITLAKPILFQDYNVRAIIEGKKDMTRRVLTPNCFKLDKDGTFLHGDNPYFLLHLINTNQVEIRQQDGRWFVTHGWNTVAYFDCPYGDVGDMFWVRESHRVDNGKAIYKADYPTSNAGWTGGIHMPRKFARLMLRIKSIKLERVSNIDEEQAKREGCIPFFTANLADFLHGSTESVLKNASYVKSYRLMWQEIHARPKPIKRHGEKQYITNVWGHRELFELMPELYAQGSTPDDPKINPYPHYYKDVPIWVNVNPLVWVIEFEVYGGKL